jgi:formylglycine-generating enzyme required for sulfatase activity
VRESAGVTVSRVTWLAAAIAVLSVGGPFVIGQGTPSPDFVEIPGGPFTMGADPARDPQAYDNERWPGAEGEAVVNVPAFYMARHEVTAMQFSAFARATGWKIDPQAIAGSPTHPVAFVSWPDALAYCRWLDSKLKQSPNTPAVLSQRLRDGWRVTLPTEAEWEKAARGTDRRRYPWGHEPRRDRANYEGRGPTPVGQFPCPECPYGLFDMSGNVWEWTSSPNQPYPYDPADDRANLDQDALWVMRGGHYGDGPRNVRTTTRGAADPGARRAFIGFRVVVSGATRGTR